MVHVPDKTNSIMVALMLMVVFIMLMVCSLWYVDVLILLRISCSAVL